MTETMNEAWFRLYRERKLSLEGLKEIAPLIAVTVEQDLASGPPRLASMICQASMPSMTLPGRIGGGRKPYPFTRKTQYYFYSLNCVPILISNRYIAYHACCLYRHLVLIDCRMVFQHSHGSSPTIPRWDNKPGAPVEQLSLRRGQTSLSQTEFDRSLRLADGISFAPS